MRNKLRRPLALLLSAVMVVTMSGTPVHAVADRGQRIGQRGYTGKRRETGAGKLPPYLRWGKRLYYGKIGLPA